MRRVRAAIGSLVFLVVVPGVIAGALPYALTGWDSSGPPRALVVVGGVLVAAGAGVLLHAFAHFVMEGIGTPAPVAPTDQLVVGGAYRFVRNPMYLGVGAVIAGQGLLLGRPVLFAYLALFGGAVSAFVHLYEEPTLAERYGDQYEAYRETVPRWVPRLHTGPLSPRR